MRQRGHAQSYARQVLVDADLVITDTAGKRFLGPLNRPLYAGLKAPTPFFVPGQTVWFEPGETRRITSLETLRTLGIAMISLNLPKSQRFEGKTKKYVLARYGMEGTPMTKLPPSHYVEYSMAEKMVRLHGPNAGELQVGPWVPIESGKRGAREGAGRPITLEHYEDHTEKTWNKTLSDVWGRALTPPPLYIRDVPLIITDNNEVVCFPYDLADMPCWIIPGSRGSGKSTFMARLVSAAYWNQYLKWKIYLANDPSGETAKWALPNGSVDQRAVLGRLHEEARPLPICYVHPSAKDEYQKTYLGDVGVEDTLPWKEILGNHRTYLSLERTQEYLARIMADLLKLDSEDAVLEFLRSKDLEIKYQIPKPSANVLRAVLETLFDAKMTDLSSKIKPWLVRRPTGVSGPFTPVTAALNAGLIADLQTRFISNYPKIHSMYEAYYLQDLWMHQTRQSPPIMVFADEIHNFCKKGNTLVGGADSLFRRFAREGRTRNIGLCVIDQFFTKIPVEITGVATHVAVFQNPQEAAAIANQYGHGTLKDDIKRLDVHQCLLFARNAGGLMVYDQTGQRRSSRKDEVFIGRTLPPLCLHEPPQKKKVREELPDDETRMVAPITV